jgi:putative ABC transport system substrate-binding protein
VIALSRRAFLGGALACAGAASTGQAQPPLRLPLVGFVTERALPPPYLQALRRGLAERGGVEGRGLRIETRSADGDLERLPGILAEVIGLDVSVLVTGIDMPAILAAKKATAKVPIVFVTGGDPVESGIVPSRAKPGGNVTGYGSGAGLIQQRLTLLREVSPRARRVAFLVNHANPIHPLILAATGRVAGPLDITLHEAGVSEATELGDAFKRMQAARADALLVPDDAMFSRHRAQLIALAARDRLPAVYGDRLFVDGGGLMSMSVNLVELCGRAAGHVDRILRGARPGDLPVEDAETLELLVNVTTARALGVTIPTSLRQRAMIVS